jgi:hypothetical protein
MFFNDVTPCGHVHIEVPEKVFISRPEDGNSMFFRNTGIYYKSTSRNNSKERRLIYIIHLLAGVRYLPAAFKMLMLSFRNNSHLRSELSLPLKLSALLTKYPAKQKVGHRTLYNSVAIKNGHTIPGTSCKTTAR